MKAFFRELFGYSHHYNLELVKVFSENGGISDERPVKVFSHMLNAHHIWNCRIQQLPAGCAVWDAQPVPLFDSIEKQNFSLTMQILDEISMETVISYNNSRGEPFHNSVRDILFHVINHSTYHRGQIATLFRQNEIAPVITDYIFYKR